MEVIFEYPDFTLKRIIIFPVLLLALLIIIRSEFRDKKLRTILYSVTLIVFMSFLVHWAISLYESLNMEDVPDGFRTHLGVVSAIKVEGRSEFLEFEDGLRIEHI